MRYDSTYSALQALNKALGGEDKQPDSEYSAVINLMSTLNGDEVEAANAFEAVETIAVRAVNNELPIQQGGGSCNHNILGNITCTLNDEWYYASDFGGDGFETVYVNVPIDTDFKIPDVQVLRWNDLEYEGEKPYFIIKVSDGIQPVSFGFGWVNAREGIPFGSYDIEDLGNGDWKVTSRDLVPPCGNKTRNIELNDIMWNFNGVTCMKYIYNQIQVRVEYAVNCDTWVEFIPDGGINKVSDPLQEGTFEETQGWGNPDEAIPMTLNEFVNAEGYAEDQWFELTGKVTGMPQLETGRITIDDDEYSGTYGDREGLFINGVNRYKYNDSDGWAGDLWDHPINDRDIVTLRTLRHKVDVNGETKICGGKGYGSPLAIIVSINGTPVN